VLCKRLLRLLGDLRKHLLGSIAVSREVVIVCQIVPGLRFHCRHPSLLRRYL
jgi:hypothetical protein